MKKSKRIKKTDGNLYLKCNRKKRNQGSKEGKKDVLETKSEIGCGGIIQPICTQLPNSYSYQGKKIL